jgi:hypothetical protein
VTAGRSSGSAPADPFRERKSPTPAPHPEDQVWSRPLRPVYALFAGVLIVAVVLFVVGAILTSSRGDLPFEVAKAGVQLFAIVLLGGTATFAFGELNGRREQRREIAAEARDERRKLDAEAREERRRLDAYRAEVAGELIGAYHRVKAVRRTLRAAGFEPPVSGTLTVEQRTEFWEQLKLLNACQLTLEKVSRDIKGQPEVYGEDSAFIKREVDNVEHHVNEIIADWEKQGRGFIVGADLGTIMAPADRLRSFLLGARVKEDVANPIADAAVRIHALRLRTSQKGAGTGRDVTTAEMTSGSSRTTSSSAERL